MTNEDQPSEQPAQLQALSDTQAVEENHQPVVQHLNRPRNGKPLAFLAGLILISLIGILGLVIKGNNKDQPAKPIAATKTQKNIDLIRIGDASSKLNSVYPDFVDPIGYEYDIAKQVFEPLVRYKDINNIEPALAESWINKPSNEKVWTFTIKKGVKFHNGSVLTPQSVKLSIEALSKNDYISYFLDSLDSVEVVGSNQVQITTKVPDPLLLNKLTNILIYDTQAKTQPSLANGTGPYALKPGTSATESSLQLVASKDWHGGDIGTKSLQFSVDTEEALDKGIINGNLDLIFKGNEIKSLDKYGLKEYKLPLLTTSYIFTNTFKKNTPVANKQVRRAIAGIIDKQALIKASGVPAVVADQIVTKAIPGHLPDYTAPKLTEAEAKKVLADAGFTKPIKLKVVFVKGNAAVNQIAAELKNQLAPIGIELSITPEESDLVLASFNQAKYDIGLFSYASDLVDLSDVISGNFQKATATNLNYDNPEVNKAMEIVNTTFDPSRRLKSLQEAHKLLLEDFAVIPYRSPIESFYVKKNIDLKADNTGYLGINFWDTYQN